MKLEYNNPHNNNNIVHSERGGFFYLHMSHGFIIFVMRKGGD